MFGTTDMFRCIQARHKWRDVSYSARPLYIPPLWTRGTFPPRRQTRSNEQQRGNQCRFITESSRLSYPFKGLITIKKNAATVTGNYLRIALLPVLYNG